MSQADGYVRIVTQNDTTEAQRSTEQLGDTIRDSLDTSQVDRMSGAFDGVRQGVDDTGTAALSTGQLIKANLISDTIMQGVQQLGAALKETAVQAVSMAMGNETAFAKVTTLLKGDDIQKYYEGLIDISNRTGIAFNDLAESMYSALSASVPQDNVLEFVENSVKLSKGGFTQTATAIDIVTTALNAYQMEMSEASHVQDVLITTQNLGKTTVDELANNMGKLIPTANSVNVAFDQLGAMYATVTANGVATAEATTYLNAMINELGASGSTAEKAMMAATSGTDMAGKKFSEISAMGYDVTDVLVLMSDYAKSTGQSLADMFSSSEGAKAANILLSNMEGFKDNIEAMGDSFGAASTAAETMMDTTAEKVQVAKNQIDNLESAIGDSLLPVIGEAAEDISEALNSSDIQDVAKNVGSFISGTLTLLLKNLDLILSTVTGITAAVIAFKTANMMIGVINSWQNAALQVKLLGSAQEYAAVKTAAANGELTLQEVIYAALSGKLDMATVKTYALNTAMSLNPAGAIAAAVGLLATALTGFAISAGNASSAANELNDSVNQMNSNIENSISENEAEMSVLKDKAKRYEELRSSINLTSEEQAELKSLAQELQEVLGDEVTVVNQLTGEYNDLTAAVDNYIIKKSASVKLSAYEDAAKEAYIIKANAEKTLSELSKTFNSSAMLGKTPLEIIQMGKDIEAAQNAIAEADATIAEWQRLETEAFTSDSKPDSGTYEWGVSIAEGEKQKALAAQAAWEEKRAQILAQRESDKELYKQFRADAKYSYDMGAINANEYYSQLAVLRDKYLYQDSEEWRSVNVEIKKYYDSLSNEQKKAYEQQLAAQEKAAEEAAKARVSAYNEEKSQLEFRLRTNKISEKKYYEELAKIRDKYLDKNSDEWRSSYLETYEYNQKILQANKDALNQLLTDTSDSTLSALQNIISARDSLAAKLVDFNKTFEKITETVPETIAVKGNFTITTAEHEVETYKMGADSIEDNIRVLEQYGEMLDALKSRGADENTLNDILAMDIEEGMDFGSKLLKMSNNEWNSYFSSMEKLRQTAADISAKYYQSEVDNLKENFVDKLRNELDGLGSDMYKIGADVAKEFVSGWNEALGTKDLTLGDLMKAVSGGTLDTAPRAAQQLTSKEAAAASTSAVSTALSAVSLPIYIGSYKLTDLLIDAANGKIIKDGKNVLLT